MDDPLFCSELSGSLKSVSYWTFKIDQRKDLKQIPHRHTLHRYATYIHYIRTLHTYTHTRIHACIPTYPSTYKHATYVRTYVEKYVCRNIDGRTDRRFQGHTYIDMHNMNIWTCTHAGTYSLFSQWQKHTHTHMHIFMKRFIYIERLRDGKAGIWTLKQKEVQRTRDLEI